MQTEKIILSRSNLFPLVCTFSHICSKRLLETYSEKGEIAHNEEMFSFCPNYYKMQPLIILSFLGNFHRFVQRVLQSAAADVLYVGKSKVWKFINLLYYVAFIKLSSDTNHTEFPNLQGYKMIIVWYLFFRNEYNRLHSSFRYTCTNVCCIIKPFPISNKFASADFNLFQCLFYATFKVITVISW